jgi:hypothetical protein
MQDFELGNTTECNPDCVYVPAQGWWCRQCGVFSDVDDADLCANCPRDTRAPGHPTRPRRRAQL